MDYLDFEFIFVNDGSSDNTIDVIKKIKKRDKRVKYISFSRNFGKEAAMLAGLENSCGDYVTLMDADLQDPPSLLEEMYLLIVSEGYDCIGTRRVTRKGEPPIRSFFARMFYKVINKMSKVELVDGARDYRLMTRQVVDSILELNEYNRFSKGLFQWVGFNIKWLEYENVEIFFFQNREEIICNLNNYADYTHYHGRICKYMVECFQNGECQVTLENLEEELDVLYRLAADYDYEAIFDDWYN